MLHTMWYRLKNKQQHAKIIGFLSVIHQKKKHVVNFFLFNVVHVLEEYSTSN